jgi:hypothetical protein
MSAVITVMLQFLGPGPRAGSRPPMRGSGLAVMPSLREDYMAPLFLEIYISTSDTKIILGSNPEPTFHFDADPDPDPSPNFTHVGKFQFFFTFIHTAAPVYIVLSFSSVSQVS